MDLRKSSVVCIIVIMLEMMYVCPSRYYTKNTYPNIRTDPQDCTQYDDIRPLYVCDPEGVLEKYQVEYLNKNLMGFQNQTSCICANCTSKDAGVKAYVAISKNIFRKHQAHHLDIMVQMAKDIRRKWSFGTCNDDLLIFTVTNDSMLHTSVGHRTQERLTANFTRTTDNKWIRRSDNVYIKVMNMIDAYKTKLQNVEAEMRKEPPEPTDNTGIIIAAVVGGIVGAVLLIIILVVFIKSGKMGKTNLERNRPPTDPDMKIKHTGSIVYSEVNKEDPGDKEVIDTKLAVDDDMEPPKKEKEDKLQNEEEKKDDKPEKDNKNDSPKPPPVAPKPAKNTPPTPGKNTPPTSGKNTPPTPGKNTPPTSGKNTPPTPPKSDPPPPKSSTPSSSEV